MAARARKGRLAQAFLVAASMIAISAGAAHAQQADELDTLNQQILANPQDAELNLRYAAAAERAGKPRLALAAYERILINDPSNAEARRGYERIRRELEPGFTTTRLEVGARWDSNALSTNDEFFNLSGDEPEATIYYAKLGITNEHDFFGARWRSILNATVEDTSDIDPIDYNYIGIQTGPMFHPAPHMTVMPAVGASMSWLGGEEYFTEYNFGLTVEGRVAGASYWARVRHGYREYDNNPNLFLDPVMEEGSYTELQTGLVKPRLLSERDALLIAPFARWSDIEGDIFSFWIFDNLAPGQFTEYGVDVNYTYRFNDHVEGSIGALVRERDFEESIREDSYVSPQASLVLHDVLPCDCDIRLQYRYRENSTNDESAEYDANQVTLALTTRF
jgi:hypothetical protein